MAGARGREKRRRCKSTSGAMMMRGAEVDAVVAALGSGHVMVTGDTGSGKTTVLAAAAAAADPAGDNTFFVAALAWSEARGEIDRFLERRVSRRTPRLVVIDDIDFYVTTTGSASIVFTDLRAACAPKTTGVGARYLVSSTRALSTRTLSATAVHLPPLPPDTLRRFCLASSRTPLPDGASQAATVAAAQYPSNLHMIARAVDDPDTTIDTSLVTGLVDTVRGVVGTTDPERLSGAWAQHGVELVGAILDFLGNGSVVRSSETAETADKIADAVSYYAAFVAGRTEFQMDADVESVALVPFAGSCAVVPGRALTVTSMMSSVIKARSTRISRALAHAHAQCRTYSELEMERP